MIIRYAEQEDAKIIFDWRNDRLSRSMMIQNQPISWHDHLNWFKNTLKLEKSHILIGYYEDNKELVGMVRFDIREKKANISINLNPYWRGKKVSSVLLDLSIKKFTKMKKIILQAKIKKENHLSKKCFERCDFTHHKQDNNFDYYRRSIS